MSFIAKKVVSFIGLLVTAIVGVILRKVFQVWGIFDPLSEWLGGWLKMHVTPAQVECSAQPVSDQVPLNRAIYLIAQRSSWGREFAAQYLTHDNHAPTSERNIMQNATHLLTEAAMKGRVEIKGRKVGEIQFEPIHPDTWQLICLDIQPDGRTLWRVSTKYNSPLTKEQKDRVPQYDSLSISESALRREWPEKDCKRDA
jgi:hypothetical protein